MRIATPDIAAASSPAAYAPAANVPAANVPHDVSDLVSPSRLFQLAAIRLEAAIATSEIGGPNTAPAAIVAVMALQQAQSGLNSLQSVNVPSTPFDVRTRAARAMDHVRQAISLLQTYHGDVADMGDRAHRRDSLPTETVKLIDDGRRELRTAIAIASNP